jgi:hypothetical protein
MLAEKFFLLLETLLLETLNGRSYPDGSFRVISTSRHVPIDLPTARYSVPEARAR